MKLDFEIDEESKRVQRHEHKRNCPGHFNAREPKNFELDETPVIFSN